MDQLDPQLKDDPVPEIEDDGATNEIPQEIAEAQEGAIDDAGEQGEHQAFHPSLQFTSGNELSSVADYETQRPAGGPVRTGETDTPAQPFDHWPTETHTPVTQIDEQAQEAGNQQFTQNDQANQFAQGDPGHYTHPDHYQHVGTPYERRTPGASYGTYEGSKPKRKRASPQQLTLLNNIFEMTYFPSSDLRSAIGKELDMVPRSVQIWFQNRRSLWRSKAQQILQENKSRKDELMAAGMEEKEAEAKVTADRNEAAERQIQDQRASDAVEYAINGNHGSLAYALHATNTNVAAGSVDDGSITRDDEPGAWSVLAAFHQARTGVLVHQGHPGMQFHEQHMHQQHQMRQQQQQQQQQHGMQQMNEYQHQQQQMQQQRIGGGDSQQPQQPQMAHPDSNKVDFQQDPSAQQQQQPQETTQDVQQQSNAPIETESQAAEKGQAPSNDESQLGVQAAEAESEAPPQMQETDGQTV